MSSIFIYSQFVEIDFLCRSAAVSAASKRGAELQPRRSPNNTREASILSCTWKLMKQLIQSLGRKNKNVLVVIVTLPTHLCIQLLNVSQPDKPVRLRFFLSVSATPSCTACGCDTQTQASQTCQTCSVCPQA